MSKLKVGDRVVVVGPGLHEGNRGVIVVDDDAQNGIRYVVRFDPPAPQTGDDSYTWATAKDLRRLVKRKRSKAATPDRVMVAAQLMSFVSRWNTPLDREQDDEYAARIWLHGTDSFRLTSTHHRHPPFRRSHQLLHPASCPLIAILAKVLDAPGIRHVAVHP